MSDSSKTKRRLKQVINHLLTSKYDTHINIQKEDKTLLSIKIGDHQKKKKIYMRSFFLEIDSHKDLGIMLKEIKSVIKTHQEIIKKGGNNV